METVQVELKVPKEFKEIVDLLDAIIEKVNAKAELTEYSALLPKLMEAINGVEKIKDEANSEYRDEAVGYLVHKLMSRLLPVEKKEEA